jgi:hypothetical protein
VRLTGFRMAMGKDRLLSDGLCDEI